MKRNELGRYFDVLRIVVSLETSHSDPPLSNLIVDTSVTSSEVKESAGTLRAVLIAVIDVAVLTSRTNVVHPGLHLPARGV